MKVKIFTEEVFLAKVIFVFDSNEMHIKEYFKKKFDHEEDFSDCYGQTGSFKHNSIVKFYIYLEKGTDKSILVHEIVHLVEIIFKNRDIEFNNELTAFYTEYWFKKLSKFIKE